MDSPLCHSLLSRELAFILVTVLYEPFPMHQSCGFLLVMTWDTVNKNVSNLNTQGFLSTTRRSTRTLASQQQAAHPSPPYSSLAEILVLAGTAGAGRMAPPTSTRISARMNRVKGHVSSVDIAPYVPTST